MVTTPTDFLGQTFSLTLFNLEGTLNGRNGLRTEHRLSTTLYCTLKTEQRNEMQARQQRALRMKRSKQQVELLNKG